MSKKFYNAPEMELTECIMLRSAVCSGTGNPAPEEPGGTPDPLPGLAPKRPVF